MPDLSIIIPERNEPYGTKTVQDLLDKAETDIEIIVHVDERWPEIVKDKRVTYLHPDTPKGMRAGINAGLTRAKSKYVMKVDAHCLFAQGFDKTLLADMQNDWLVVPRRYALHLTGWKKAPRIPCKDYHFISYPKLKGSYGISIFPREWKQRMRERRGNPLYDIDDTMILQGSCWLANKDYFMKRVGFLDDSPDHYSTFSGEQLEVGLKYWLGGGAIKVNKNTWYAHLFKNRHYYESRPEAKKNKESLKATGGWAWSAKHWLRNEEPKMLHPFSWLVEKFWPVPSWPEDRSLWTI